MAIKEDIIIQKKHWQATHSHLQLTGLRNLSCNNQTLIKNIHCYTDSVSNESTRVSKIKNCNKAGIHIIELEGKHCLGNCHYYRHIYRYGNHHARLTTDVRFSKDNFVKRHFGIDSFFLAGDWTHITVFPPIQHLKQGDSPYTHKINQKQDFGTLVEHWHRAPLALLFKRKDGFLFELFTGSDLWRWDNALGYKTESSSHKIFWQKGGLKIVREPLMCFQEFKPKIQDYRFSSIISWGYPKEIIRKKNSEYQLITLNEQIKLEEKLVQYINKNPVPKLILDFANFNFHSNKLATKISPDFYLENATCFTSNSVVTFFKKIAHKLLSFEKKMSIIFRNFSPSICSNSQHYSKNNEELFHWDINYTIDFALWWKNKFPEQIKLEKQHPFLLINKIFDGEE